MNEKVGWLYGWVGGLGELDGGRRGARWMDRWVGLDR